MDHHHQHHRALADSVQRQPQPLQHPSSGNISSSSDSSINNSQHDNSRQDDDAVPMVGVGEFQIPSSFGGLAPAQPHNLIPWHLQQPHAHSLLSAATTAPPLLLPTNTNNSLLWGTPGHPALVLPPQPTTAVLDATAAAAAMMAPSLLPPTTPTLPTAALPTIALPATASMLPTTTVPPVAPPPIVAYTVQERARLQSPLPYMPVYNGVNPQYPGLRVLHGQPPMFAVDNFLTADECTALRFAAHDVFQPAPVVGEGAGQVSPSRTSSTCYLAREDLATICNKVTLLTGQPVQNCELPQVGRYLSGQQYLQHFDAFDLRSDDGRRFCANGGGQRIVTILIYLNTLPESCGGATHFPALNLQVQPVQGRALVFFPATIDGLLDEAALHAALPVLGSEHAKYVSQIWIRQGPYHGTPSKRLLPELPDSSGTGCDRLLAHYCYYNNNNRLAPPPQNQQPNPFYALANSAAASGSTSATGVPSATLLPAPQQALNNNSLFLPQPSLHVPNPFR